MKFDSFAFDSIKNVVTSFLFRFGFVIWLWAYLFARVPLAATQNVFGFESRPLLLLDLLSVGFALVAFSRVGCALKLNSVVRFSGIFALFNFIY